MRVRAQRREDALLVVELGSDRGPEVVRGPTPSEGDAVVAGPLAVDDHVAVVAEHLPPGEADLVPLARAESGSVATMSEYTGTTARSWPGRRGVQPSVARTTAPAPTRRPSARTTTPSPARPTRTPSTIRPPRRRTAAARPSARSRGCTRAQCGVYVAPRPPAACRRSRAAPASSHTVPSPHAAPCSASARARSSWAAVRATRRAPPLTNPLPSPSSASTRPTSSTVSRSAARWARVAARPERAARVSADTGQSAETQPPLRPLAPKPTCSASRTSTSRPGCSRRR